MTKLQFAGAAMAALMAASLGACNKAEPAKPAVDTGKIADAVKADVAQLVTDFNAHDAAKAASHDAPDVVAMAHGQPNVGGKAADLASSQKGFAADQTQHVTVANETVDVAASGDMAVYRSTYVFSAADPKTKKPMTENGNYLAGYKLQPDGSWKIAWSIVSDTGPSPAAKS
jgi:ketosteroid isomerase-like protein